MYIVFVGSLILLLEVPFLDCGMDIIQALWAVNFFLFLLTLIFVWSKFYSISLRIKEILSILKKCDELPSEHKQ